MVAGCSGGLRPLSLAFWTATTGHLSCSAFRRPGPGRTLCLPPPPQALVLKEWAEALGVPLTPLPWSCPGQQRWQPTVGAEPDPPQVCLPACPLGASCLASWAEARAFYPTELYPVPEPGHQEQACMQEHGEAVAPPGRVWSQPHPSTPASPLLPCGLGPGLIIRLLLGH